MKMPQSRMSSPARSQGAASPRRLSLRKTRSVSSPARSTASGRLSSVIRFQDMDSFRLSPMPTRRSVLNDDTDIAEETRRRSWWKRLSNSSRDVMEVLNENKILETNEAVEEYIDIEVLSQEKKNYTMDIPDSSDSESISSIVIPQRKLFTEKENKPQQKFGQIVGTRRSSVKLHKTTDYDKTVNVAPKNLFNQTSRAKSKPVFPAELLTISPEKVVNKTKEIAAGEVKLQARPLFGNRPAIKRKNMFIDFIVSESEDEISEIHPKVFGFQKKGDPQPETSNAQRRDPSPTSSITTDVEMDEWKYLPSSTMVENQLEDMMADKTPVKKAKLSNLSTNNTGNKTKQSAEDAIKDVNVENQEQIVDKIQDHNEKDLEMENYENDKAEKELNTEAQEDNVETSNESVTIKNKNSSINSTKPNDKSITSVKQYSEKTSVESNASLNKTKPIKKSKTIDKSVKHDTVTEPNTSQTKRDINTSMNSNKSENSPSAIKDKANQGLNVQEESELDKQPRHKSVIEDEQGIKDVTVASLEHNDVRKSGSQGQNLEENKNDVEEDTEEDILLSLHYESEGDDENNQDNTNTETLEESKNILNDEVVTDSQNENFEANDNREKLAQNNSEKTNHGNETQEDIESESDIDDNDERQHGKENNDVVEESENDDQQKSQLELNASQEPDEESDQELIEQSKGEIQDASEEEEIEEEDQLNYELSEKELDEHSQEHESKHEESQQQSEEERVQSEADQTLSEAEQEQSEEKQAQSEAEQSEEEQEQSEEKQAQSEAEQSEEEQEQSEEEQAQSEAEQSEEEQEQSEKEKAQSEAEQSKEEQEQSEEEQEECHELQESQEVDPVESSAEIEDSNENNAQHDNDVDMENDDEGKEFEDTETPDVSHDTTGRHRKKEHSKVKSPEAMLHDKTKQMESFMAKGRNTSLRRTSIMKSMNIRTSLPPPRESTGLSDGTRNSSAEGSGWDSHRTTRKTLRQTFGKDFSPRKSLRALVMEKSAKRQTAVTDLTSVTSKFPQANSTEFSDANIEDNDYVVESNHDVSKHTRQTTLEMYLQKIKKQNLEKKMKMEEAIKNYLQVSQKDTNVFKVPSRPPFAARKKNIKPAQAKTTAKQKRSNLICFDDLPDEVKDDMKYKPPKRFQPSDAAWITKRLYKYIETKLEPKYDYKARVRAEKLVQTIYYFAKDLKRRDVAPPDAVDALKHELARLDIVKTHDEFYQFIREYMPRGIRIKVIPDILNKIPMPRQGVFSDILA